MSDLVERLRELAYARAGDGPSGPNYDPELLDALTGAADRIAHLERVQEAADAMRAQYVAMRGGADLPTVRAYDAVRKGEG